MIQVFGGGRQAQFSEVSFFVTRADGTVEPAVTQRYESTGHKIGRVLRTVRKALPWALLALVATRYHAVAGLLPAATVIVNGGQAIDSNLVSGIGGTVPKYVAWGTGAGTAGVTDTTLFTETTEEARTSGTVTRVTTTVTNDTLQVVGSITVVTSNKTITNVGLFDAVTTGNLYLKSDFTGQALLIGDSITFTIKNKFA